MQVMQAAKFFFQDEDWVMNMLMGTVFLIIPILGQIALGGWHAEIAQRLERGEEKPIPKLELNDLIKWFEKGVVPFVAQMLAVLPVLIIAMVLPFFFVMAMVSGVRGGALISILVMVMICIIVFSFLLSIVVVSIQTRAELSLSFKETFNIGALKAYLARNAIRILVSHFLFGMVAMGMITLGMLACFIGVYPISVALGVGSAHLRVQIYQQHLQDGGEAIPPAVEPTKLF